MKITDLKKQEDGIILETNKGNLKLQIINESIIRAVYSYQDNFSDPESFMVLPQSDNETDWSVKELEDHFKLTIPKLGVEIDKKTASFTWRDSDGKLLVEEPGDGGKELEKIEEDLPKTEEDQEFYSTKLELDFSDDEAIYGLGQHEEGTLNYRDEMQYLYQHNMKASMPTIVSTRGYGILWDTYSLSIFRDNDQKTKKNASNLKITPYHGEKIKLLSPDLQSGVLYG
ncbi:hypothetical protein AKJ65_03340 [candidate division MSBL1 archaeon SCGC-AAA259E19]|uniref:Glycoside hydrolase family 31 N-terminal domain-containing protein n=1 Tax=candidate division MSBL1 archaeon SCGC-AAA259E19 TaxID=1698264 RepID=A0A133UL06_9EURY|nr:hypothetical protein AKJ65_03340 [candidate division MSBL1 archaeon SCGC-AAA259E19]